MQAFRIDLNGRVELVLIIVERRGATGRQSPAILGARYPEEALPRRRMAPLLKTKAGLDQQQSDGDAAQHHGDADQPYKQSSHQKGVGQSRGLGAPWLSRLMRARAR